MGLMDQIRKPLNKENYQIRKITKLGKLPNETIFPNKVIFLKSAVLVNLISSEGGWEGYLGSWG